MLLNQEIIIIEIELDTITRYKYHVNDMRPEKSNFPEIRGSLETTAASLNYSLQ